MNYTAIPPAPGIVQAHVLLTSRTNFFLWMFLAQKGMYDEAVNFVRKSQGNTTPFDGLFKVQFAQLLEKDNIFDANNF